MATTKYIVDNVANQTINGNVTINGNLSVTGTTKEIPYKTYVAVVTQSGTTAPVEETVFENTLGGPSLVWERTSPGSFRIQHPSFLVTKTYVIGSFRSIAMTGPVENLFSCAEDGTVSWSGVDSTFAQPNRIYIEIRVYN